MILLSIVRHPKLGVAATFAAACIFSQAAKTANAAESLAATAPLLPYRSVFLDYQKLENFTEPKNTAWRLANEKVEKIGGWRQYAKEAARADAPAPSTTQAPAPARAPAPAKQAPALHHHHGKT